MKNNHLECMADGHFVLAGGSVVSPSSNAHTLLLSPEISVFQGGKPHFFALAQFDGWGN